MFQTNFVNSQALDSMTNRAPSRDVLHQTWPN